jgi:hypothetical protein
MRQVGSVEIPQQAFLAVLKLDRGQKLRSLWSSSAEQGLSFNSHTDPRGTLPTYARGSTHCIPRPKGRPVVWDISGPIFAHLLNLGELTLISCKCRVDRLGSINNSLVMHTAHGTRHTALKRVSTARVMTLLLLAAPASTLLAQQLSVSFTTSEYNGYNVSCFGKKDGAIDITVTGGVPPYTFHWSTGDTTEDLIDLPSGFYEVTVKDAIGDGVQVPFTLTEPEDMKVEMEPFKYPSGHNVSCYECYNGSIDVTVSYGVPPYTYDWGDEVFTQDRSGLGALVYKVRVTDANGCETSSDQVHLRQPDSDDWKMTGNANTSPSIQYIGTSDATDLVFKTNGAEALRLLSNGDVQVDALTGADERLVYVDVNGTLKKGPPLNEQMSDIPWYLGGNLNVTASTNRIGPVNDLPFRLITNDIERMRLTNTGLVGIGTVAPQDQLEVHTALPRSGLTLNNIRTDDNAHTEIRFTKNGQGRWAIGCDFEGNGGQDFFLWDNPNTVKRLVVTAQGKVGIGTEPPTNSTSIYKLYVGDGIATRDVKVTAQNWPDFVFEEDHALLSLPDLRTYLKQEKHLPGIPSAAEVAAADGVELGDMQRRLLRTVEEQALYILLLEERLARVEQLLVERKDR